jgi:hypothetical protein
MYWTEWFIHGCSSHLWNSSLIAPLSERALGSWNCWVGEREREPEGRTMGCVCVSSLEWSPTTTTTTSSSNTNYLCSGLFFSLSPHGRKCLVSRSHSNHKGQQNRHFPLEEYQEDPRPKTRSSLHPSIHLAKPKCIMSTHANQKICSLSETNESTYHHRIQTEPYI